MQEYYTVQVLDEPGTLLINGDICHIYLEGEIVLIDNKTRKQQFTAYSSIPANLKSETIFPDGFWLPGDTMRVEHGRWFNLSRPKLVAHPLALFAWHIERNRISPQMIEAGSFLLDYPFYANKNRANLSINLPQNDTLNCANKVK